MGGDEGREQLEDPLGQDVEDYLSGDRRAGRRIVRFLEPRLRRMLARMLDSSSEVDDLVQESLWAFFRALPRFRGESTLLYFACRIARHQALSQRRKARREQTHREAPDLRDSVLPPSPVAPYDELVGARCREQLGALCEQLPPAQARAFTLRFLHECSLSDIAVATAASFDTVRTRVRLARTKLRSFIALEPDLTELFRFEGFRRTNPCR